MLYVFSIQSSKQDILYFITYQWKSDIKKSYVFINKSNILLTPKLLKCCPTVGH